MEKGNGSEGTALLKKILRKNNKNYFVKMDKKKFGVVLAASF
jgi:hypothetical protein